MTASPLSLQSCGWRRALHLLRLPAVLSLGSLMGPVVQAQGFSEPDVILYGKIVHAASGSSHQLYEGNLRMTLANVGNPENRIVVETALRPAGEGEAYSYTVGIPQKYLPRQLELEQVLSTGADPTDYRFETIAVNGFTAAPLEQSRESFTTSFGRRAQQIRVDLRVALPESDTDLDGLPDWWETQHGLNPAFTGDARMDGDLDGWDNFFEFSEGTDPAESNRTPELRTTRIRVPERGRAGLLLDVVDSDSPPTDILFRVASLTAGMALEKDGTPMAVDDLFTLSDVESGRLVLAHAGASAVDGVLELDFSDSDNPATRAALEILVFQPSQRDGSDATLWLDAHAIVASDNARLSEWQDRSGSTHHAWQPENSLRPQYKANVDGLPAVDFAGSRRHFLLEDRAFSSQGLWLFVALDAPRNGSLEQVIAANRLFVGIERRGGSAPYPGSLRVSGDKAQIHGRMNVRDRRVVASIRLEGGEGAIHTDFRFDGSAEPLASPESPVEPALGLMRLAGVTGNERYSGDFNGTVREILAFPRGLSVGRARRIADYLESKWQHAIIWEWSDEGSPVRIQGGPGRDIIRGGWGADSLKAGPGADMIAGGPGEDLISGEEGSDTFFYGASDSGRDVITDFTPEGSTRDVLDLSDLFSGLSGDPRDHLSLRAEGVRVGDAVVSRTVVTVRLSPGGATVQEIVLQGIALTDADLGRLIGEGVFAVGNLAIPVTVSIAAGPSSPSNSNPSIVLAREGNTDHTMDVPLYLSAEGRVQPGFTLASATTAGDRVVATFGRGESVKTLALIPEDDSTQHARIRILPQAHFDLAQASVEVLLSGDAAANSYHEWAGQTFPSDSPAPRTSPEADFDEDEVVNAAEYIFGSDPTDPTDGRRHPLLFFLSDGHLVLRVESVVPPDALELDLLRRDAITGMETVVTDAFLLSQQTSRGRTAYEFRSHAPVSALPTQGFYRLRMRLLR